jgi:hypothetical protein
MKTHQPAALDTLLVVYWLVISKFFLARRRSAFERSDLWLIATAELKRASASFPHNSAKFLSLAIKVPEPSSNTEPK